jgi:hypothetical protein
MCLVMFCGWEERGREAAAETETDGDRDRDRQIETRETEKHAEIDRK